MSHFLCRLIKLHALLACCSLAVLNPAHAVTPPVFVDLSMGSSHACAVLNTGGVLCWGANGSGQLGNNSTVASMFPTPVNDIRTALRVSAGGLHTCALLIDETVWCWGANTNGRLGDGTTIGRLVPVQAIGLSTAKSVSSGTSHTCAKVGFAGHVYCWGQNFDGRLGLGDNTERSTPTLLSALTNISEVAAGGNSTCARLPTGNVRCWGGNLSGQLGNNTLTGSNTPVDVNLISAATKISVGTGYACARLSDGSLRCWGANGNGALGDGTLTNQAQPVAVNGINAATDVDAGDSSTCARLSDATLRCWGNATAGGLGNGATGGISPPVIVKTITNAIRVNVSGFSGCTLLADGSIRCWGTSNGFLGDGTPLPRLIPTPILAGPCLMDIDGDGAVAGNDALLLGRASFGFGGTAVTNNALTADARRPEWASIRAYLTVACGLTGLAP